MEPHVDLRSRNGLGRGDYNVGRANRLVRFLPPEVSDKLNIVVYLLGILATNR